MPGSKFILNPYSGNEEIVGSLLPPGVLRPLKITRNRPFKDPFNKCRKIDYYLSHDAIDPLPPVQGPLRSMFAGATSSSGWKT